MCKSFGNIFVFALLGMMLACSSEQKEGNDIISILCITSEATSITQTSAILNGAAAIKNAKASNANTYFYYSTTQGDAKTLKASGQRFSAGTIPNTGGDFSANLSSLLPATTYYYVASVSIDDQEELGGVKSFTTEKKTDSFSVTGTAIDVTVNSATLTAYANLPADMTGDVTIGIIYSTNSSPSLQNGKLLTSKDLDANNMYQVEATELTPDTKYYFKSFLSRSNLNYYGEVKEFTTAQVLASVSTLDAWDVAETKAMVGGKVDISSQGVQTKSSFVYYGTDGTSADALKTKGKKVSIEAIDEDGTFKTELTSLTASTKYYFIAVATIEGVEFAGAIKNFTTQDKPKEISVTGESADIGVSSAILYGWCNQDGAEGISVVFGIEYSATDLTTEATTIIASEKDAENKYCCQATGLSDNTLYYYRAFTLFNGVRSYGEVKTFITHAMPVPQAVDMGTIVNGKNIKWASFNVGASSPEEYGFYYAWGETEPKSNYSWSTYKFGKAYNGPFSKYNTTDFFGTVDNKTELVPDDDVAHVKLGGKWRIPTDEEWIALLENCAWTRSIQNGNDGYLVTAKNGNSLFFPAAGYRYDARLGSAGSYGCYWSSSLYTDGPYNALYVYFNSDGVRRLGDNRYLGLSVRPVTE